MKFLTLNIYKGKCLKEILSFLEKEQFDLIHLQEVSGKKAGFDDLDCFKEIKEQTGLTGELLPSWHITGDPASYFGNATFFKPSLQVLERREVWLTPFATLDDLHKSPPQTHPKSVLLLKIKSGQNTFWSINAHLPWGPTPYDEPYKIAKAEMLANEMKTLDAPCILSGDFNVVKETETCRLFAPLGRNLAAEMNITNTLNPRLHRVKELFPPGLAVDFIFIDPSIDAHDFRLLDNYQLSDHVGLSVELGFKTLADES